MIARTEVRNGPEEMILYHIQSHYTYSIESGINVLPGKFGKKNKRSPIYTLYYSRVHKRWQSFFSKILEKPSIVQKKMLPHIKGLDFSQR